MATSILPFRKIQAGIETTKGTAVPATRVLVGDGRLDEEQEYHRSSYPRGVRATVGGAGIVVRKGSMASVTSELTAQEVLWPLLMGVRGGVSSVADATDTATYVWTFTPQLTQWPDVDAATIEFIEGDGTTNHIAVEAAYCLCRSLGITANINQAIELTYELFGKAASTTTPTGALTPYANRDAAILPATQGAHYLDAAGAWADLGTTQLTGVVRTVSFNLTTGLEPDYTADGSTNVDFSVHAIKAPLSASLSITLELDATGAAKYTHFRDNDLLYIRNDWQGVIVENGGTLRYGVRIDGHYRVTSTPSFSTDGDLVLVQMDLEAVYDATEGKILEIVVTNDLAAVA